MNFSREIFFRKSKQEKSENNIDDFVFDIDNCNLSDKKTQEYFEKLKEEDVASYYSILEKLSEKEILKREEKVDSEDYSNLDDISFEELENDNPSEEYYQRFSKIKEDSKSQKRKIKNKAIIIPFNPYK
jgi:hypothetical protein